MQTMSKSMSMLTDVEFQWLARSCQGTPFDLDHSPYNPKPFLMRHLRNRFPDAAEKIKRMSQLEVTALCSRITGRTTTQKREPIERLAALFAS
jgi:hypothetical protein